MEEAQQSDIAAIGDKVKIHVSTNEDRDDIGTIVNVAERKSTLSRSVRTTGNRGAGAPEREQVIIANAQQALFVFAAANPNPDLQMLDRFLVAGESSGIEDLLIVVNKIDLMTPEEAERLFQPYDEMGYRILYTSAVENRGVDALREQLSGRISVLTGPSGVGKTSLLNAVQPGLGRAVKSVSTTSGEGMHTTRDSALIKLETGGYLADTPGIRQLTAWDVEPDELDAYFIDIAPYVEDCKFGNCTHGREPGCAVVAAVKAGKIAKHRFKHYRKMRDELDQLYAVY